MRSRKPDWFRRELPRMGRCAEVAEIISRNRLKTVCTEAMCPNRPDCFSRGTATFLLLGPRCTRRCTFCNVEKGETFPADPSEPGRVAAAICQLGLQYAVITMVTRDDLSDGGAHHVAETVRLIADTRPELLVELLVSDLSGNWDSLAELIAVSPAVLGHNIETCGPLYPDVRPRASYQRSLELISRSNQSGACGVTKSGFMVGLGETREQISELLDDLSQVGTKILTVGQYLAPTRKHRPVIKFYAPEEFLDIEAEALSKGFSSVACGPWVRSSYRAKSLYEEVTLGRCES